MFTKQNIKLLQKRKYSVDGYPKKTSSNVTDLQTKRGKKKRNRAAWIQLCDSWVQGRVAKNSNAVGNPPVRYPLVFF